MTVRELSKYQKKNIAKACGEWPAAQDMVTGEVGARQHQLTEEALECALEKAARKMSNTQRLILTPPDPLSRNNAHQRIMSLLAASKTRSNERDIP